MFGYIYSIWADPYVYIVPPAHLDEHVASNNKVTGLNTQPYKCIHFKKSLARSMNINVFCNVYWMIHKYLSYLTEEITSVNWACKQLHPQAWKKQRVIYGFTSAFAHLLCWSILRWQWGNLKCRNTSWLQENIWTVPPSLTTVCVHTA